LSDPKHLQLIAVGTLGVSMSSDGGHTWGRLDSQSYNAVVAMPAPATGVWMAGDRSTTAVLVSAGAVPAAPATPPAAAKP
jgi:hypothetical protein